MPSGSRFVPAPPGPSPGRPGPVLPELSPELEFAVIGAEGVAYAAVPTLRFELRVRSSYPRPIRSVILDVQLQIAARRRGYQAAEEAGLLELFGTTDRWSTTLRTLPWTRTTRVVPPFTGETLVDLDVQCSYDLEVTASRYFAALKDGEVPLEFLFSGSVFFAPETGGLRTARIGWDREAEFRLPVATWKETMGRHFPDCTWLRLGERSFERLLHYKARHAFTSWEATIDALLDEAGEEA